MSDNTIDTEINVNDVPVIPEVVEAEHPAGIEMSEWVFTNDKTNKAIRDLFHVLYNGAFANKLGLMHALHEESGEVHTVIVGIEQSEEGIKMFPLAKVLGNEELQAYKAPDGNGNYFK